MVRSLQKRLQEYKIMKQAILEGESETGYTVSYEGGFIKYSFEELDGKLILNGRSTNDNKNLRLLDVGQEEEAKKLYFNNIMKFLRRNTYIPSNRDGAIFSRSVGASSHYNILTFPSPWETTSFGKLSKKMQDRVNNERRRRGFSPAIEQVRAS